MSGSMRRLRLCSSWPHYLDKNDGEQQAERSGEHQTSPSSHGCPVVVVVVGAQHRLGAHPSCRGDPASVVGTVSHLPFDPHDLASAVVRALASLQAEEPVEQV